MGLELDPTEDLPEEGKEVEEAWDGTMRRIRISHRLGCPHCQLPMLTWLQDVQPGASVRILIVCERCWKGFQAVTKQIQYVQFQPFYKIEEKPATDDDDNAPAGE